MRIPEKYMFPNEVAKFLGVSITTVYNFQRRKLLTPYHLYGHGRGKPTFYLRKDVERFFEENVKGGDA